MVYYDKAGCSSRVAYHGRSYTELHGFIESHCEIRVLKVVATKKLSEKPLRF